MNTEKASGELKNAYSTTQELKVESPAPKPARLVSLDAFRGLTIALMLLVNNTALDTATPAQLMHAPWNAGVRLADLVFPWFLFCVGVAVPFSAASFRRKGLPVWRYDLKAIGRAAALVLLGCLIDSSLNKTPVFGLGVLQIIGLAYLVGAMLYDLPVSRRLILAGIFLFGYWAAIKYLPIPGVGSGVFEEEQNLITHLNRTYLAPFHLAGLLSVIPTASMVLIGTVIGDVLMRKDFRHMRKALFMVIAGLVLVGGGLLWNLSLPFNKPVWTPSYILFTAGTGSLVLGLFYLVIDALGWRWWAYPAVVFGSNAIVAYVAPILVKVHMLQEWTVGSVPVQQWYLNTLIAHHGRIPGGWLYTATYIAFWWVTLFILYRKKMFLRV